ncbi:MAG TPA: CBS domain-containing protein [Nitrososphaerales archaeon]|nr:CBS domain-containing protein [Nitrososphaerales archaeon]
MIYVKDIMTRSVRTIAPEATVADAAKLMVRWKIGSLVISDGKSPKGIITEGDISRCVAKGMSLESKLKAFSRKKLFTVPSYERVEVAAKLMSENNIKKLPVMDDGKLVGIITQTDIVASSFSLITSLKEMVQARYRPPDFEM